MEQHYVIGVANKFDALLDSEDPFEVLQNVEAEKQKKKALKAASSNENKENKVKDASEVKNKAARKPAAKPTDRVLAADRNVKPETPVERANNRRNREERPPGNERNGEFPRTGTFRDGGGKPEGAPRGPRPDGPRGEKRDGPRPFRGEGENRPPRGPRPDGEQRPFRNDRQQGVDGDSRPPRKERREFNDPPDGEGRADRRPGGGPRGRGSRPPGPGRNYDTRGKREFDRKSGSDRTGVKAVDKRDGAGSFNWDSNKDVDALTNDLNVTNLSDEQTDWDELKLETEPAPVVERKEDEPEPEETAPPAEEEPKELTLDEYRAIRGKREKPQYDIRKAGEGEDLTQWKDMVEIKKKNEEDQDLDDDLEIPDYPQRVGRQRHVVGIDITFNDAFRGRGRGRGAGPGGRGRGRGGERGDRGDRPERIDRGDRGGGDRGDRGDRDRGDRGDRDRGDRGDRDRGDRGDRDRGEREPMQRRFPREDRKDVGSRQSAPKVDDEKDFPSLG